MHTTSSMSQVGTPNRSTDMQSHSDPHALADPHMTADMEMDLEAASGGGELTATSDPSDAAYARHHQSTRRNRVCARYGRTWVLYSCSREYGYFPVTAHVGPHWPCMLLTYAIAIAPAFLVLLSDEFKLGFRIALLISSVLTTLVFSMVACSDPGVIYDSDQPLTYLATADRGDGGGVICAQCHIRRPKTASHCSECGVCVNKLDHHCPWTGKCIGTRTLWVFYVFLWCISVHIILLSVGCTITYLSR